MKNWFMCIAIILVILFIPAWPDGSPAGGPATGTYVSEERVDTVSSMWDIHMRSWSGTAVISISNAGENAQSLINVVNEWSATPIFCEGDSVYLDSIVVYGTGNAMDIDDTLIVKIKEPATPIASHTTTTTIEQKIPGAMSGTTNFTFVTGLSIGPGEKSKYTFLLRYHYKSDAHSFIWGHTVFCYTAFYKYRW